MNYTKQSNVNLIQKRVFVSHKDKILFGVMILLKYNNFENRIAII